MAMQQQFKLRPSRCLAFLLAIAHMIALAILVPLEASAWLKLILGLAVLYSALHSLRRDAWIFASPSSTVLTLENEGVVRLVRNGKMLEGRVLPDSAVLSYLVVLNIAPKDGYLTQSVIILPDSLDTESFRQLRVQLKWGAQNRVAAYPPHPDFS